MRRSNKNHYQTNHLIATLARKRNGDAVILREGAVGMFRHPEDEPRPLDKEMVAKLNELFEGGADILFSSDWNWADEGGNCYEAWILKAEYVSSFWEGFHNSSGERGSLYLFGYLANNPDRFWHLWTGPY